MYFDSFNYNIQKPRESFLVFTGYLPHLGSVPKGGKLYMSREFEPLAGIA